MILEGVYFVYFNLFITDSKSIYYFWSHSIIKQLIYHENDRETERILRQADRQMDKN